MQSEIHVHRVLEMLEEAGRPMSLSRIESDLYERYGADVRFRGCSKAGMDFTELIEFLKAKRKISLAGENIQNTNGGVSCSDE